MTGRELIVYILQNELEDVEMFKNGFINLEVLGFMTADEAAVKFGVGPSTITVWHNTGVLKGVYDERGDLHIPKDARDPRCM